MANAQLDCASNNGQLVVINSEDEFSFVNGMRNAGQDVWVKIVECIKILLNDFF